MTPSQSDIERARKIVGSHGLYSLCGGKHEGPQIEYDIAGALAQAREEERNECIVACGEAKLRYLKGGMKTQAQGCEAAANQIRKRREK